MSLISKFLGKINNFTYLLENPNLWRLYFSGIDIGILKLVYVKYLLDYKFKTILDIGAHTGKFSYSFRSLYPEAKIYAFEPIEECYKKLVGRMSQKSLFYAFNIALGNESGNIEFEKNEYTPASSILKINDLHKKLFPIVDKTNLVNVEIDQLDNIFSKISITKPVLIKMDVQGYEGKVIEGGMNFISKCDVIVIETSYEKLYEDQSDFSQVYNYLSNLGFKYVGSLSQMQNPHNGKVIQSDSVFIK